MFLDACKDICSHLAGKISGAFRKGTSPPIKSRGQLSHRDKDSTASALVDEDAGDSATEPLEVSYPEEDRMLSNSSWVKLVEECVGLFSEIERRFPVLSEPQQKLATHILNRLTEILQRSGVTLIDNDSQFDPGRHTCEPSSAGVSRGAPIVKTIRHGFALGRRVFLKALVKVDQKRSIS